jgi:16S rRNA (guanine(966)-N(2))-methyltransferase RsmD
MQTSPKRSSKAARTDPKRAAAAARVPGQVRIIGGQWKRTKLLVADKPGLRPTPDRVRETVFNWLGQDMTGWRCLDAFAGTGALGLEAASRGAREVRLVEQDPGLVRRLKDVQTQLEASSVQVLRGDGISVLKQCAAASLDLVFLDPPFDSCLFDGALKAVGRVVQADGYVYLEAPRAWDDVALAPFGLRLYRYLLAGAVHAHLLRPLGGSAGTA